MRKPAGITVAAVLVTAFVVQAAARDDRREGAALADDASPAATAARLAYARKGIVLIDRDGTDKNVLTQHRGWIDYAPAWSPDGGRIAFTRTTDGYRSFHIYVMSATGKHVRRVTAGRFDEDPSWSPDGRWLAYGSRHGITLIRPDGTGKHGVRGTRSASHPDWSPDGRQLAFSQDDYVWTARPNGRARERIVKGREADWSPDGRKLAYMPPDGGVATVRSVGGGQRFLGKGMEPAWSPDGRRIAFARWPESNVFSVWVMRADGTGRHRVARPGSQPAWRPDPG